jgi:hypothetical protein
MSLCLLGIANVAVLDGDRLLLPLDYHTDYG